MFSIPVSKTKIIPPRRRAELLTRKRLLDMLFDSLDRKLVLVSAPAGYGKTSLLIDLVQQSEYKCCWLSLDELDREPQRFITYLLASIAEQFPGFGNQTAAVLSGLTSLENEMERLSVMLVNEMYDSIHEHFVLILDDFHILDGAQPIHDLLNRFIQLMDDNCHVVITSRILISLYDLPLMVARDQVSGLSFSDLAFRTDEIQALILQNNKVHISDEDAKKLIDETEGWITGLQFSGVNFAHKDITRPVSNIGVGLFDYLGHQVLDRQTTELRKFLLRTSIMEEFDAGLCESVLSPFYKGKQDWDALIKAIVQNNLFALPVGSDGRSLRYHHLFRDYLRTRLERENKDEIKPILLRLGQAYEAMGEWEKAHYVIKQVNDPDSLAEMIERAGFIMLQRAFPTVESWLNELPPSLLRNRPGMLSIRGTIAFIKGNLREGLKLLNQAEKSFREEENVSGLTLALLRRASGYRYLGDYHAAICDTDEIIQLTEANDDLQMIFADALRVKGLALYRLGQTRQAVDFLERSLEVFTRLNDTINIPVLFMETGMAYDALGKYPEASSFYEKALHIWKQDANLSLQSNLLNNMGYMYHLQGEYEKAAFAYEDGLLCARRSRNTRLNALICIGLGDLYAELQDFEIALQNYQHAASLIGETEDRFLLYSLHLGRANLFLLQNDLDNAHKIINELTDNIKPDQSHYESGHLSLVRGKYYLLGGFPLKAVRELEKAECHFVEDGRETECAVARLWLAAAYNKNNDHARASQKIKLLAGNRGQVAHAVLVAITQSRTWLDGLQKVADLGHIVRNLFAQSERVALKMPAIRRELRRQARVVQVPTPRLSIQAFGISAVSIGGKVLNISDWQTQSVRDLFFFFLTQTRPLTKDQIAETLWPEHDEPAKIRLRFKNEMYRLRRAVGQDAIRFENALYSFNRDLDYEYDVDAFESFLLRAKSLETPSEQIEHYRKAVDLVHGPYLNDIYFDWVMADREQLKQMYLSALLTLAGLYQQQAFLDDALAMCQRAVECEPTYEAAYRLSMQIYHRLGDRSAIIRTYQACIDALKQHLSMPPSKETEDLYRKLIS